MYYCCAMTNKGTRPHNEDALLIHKTVLTDGVTECELSKPFLLAVADGVSGELSGEIASSACLHMLKGVSFSSRMDMKQKLSSIHEALTVLGTKQEDTQNMQTTLCALGVDEYDMLHSMNVGDSRLYRCRQGHLTQLSRDQSYVQILYEAGIITEEEKQTHVKRNIILPVLGNLNEQPEFDVREHREKIEYGDILLLCSDGLSDYVSKSDMEQILLLPKPLVRRLQLLMELALKNKSSDNITMIALVRMSEKFKK